MVFFIVRITVVLLLRRENCTTVHVNITDAALQGKWEADCFCSLPCTRKIKYKFVLQYSIVEYNGQASLHLDLQWWNILTHLGS